MLTPKWDDAGWSLTKREGIEVNIVFFCFCTNWFFSLRKKEYFLTLIEGGFGPGSHLKDPILNRFT